MKKLLIASMMLSLFGCPQKAKTTTPVNTTTPTKPSSEVVTLLRLENGDRACYVVVQIGNGDEASMEGDFELCEGGPKDATKLIGHKVTYTTKKANVLAASCQGDVDCGKSDEVDLVISLTQAD